MSSLLGEYGGDTDKAGKEYKKRIYADPRHRVDGGGARPVGTGRSLA